MAYKSVEFTASITHNDNSETVARQLQSIIDSQASQGWEYVRIETIEAHVASENGCFGFGAKPAFSTYFPVIIFQKSGTSIFKSKDDTFQTVEHEAITESLSVALHGEEPISTSDSLGRLKELDADNSTQVKTNFDIREWVGNNKKVFIGIFIGATLSIVLYNLFSYYIRQSSINTSHNSNHTPVNSIILKSYSGKVGKLNAAYNLTWNPDGTIEGNYLYPTRPNVIYKLRGRDLGNGKITLTEFTGNTVSANCNLFLQNDCYIGEMNNTDGRILKMSMCVDKVASTGYIQTRQGSDLRLRSQPSQQAPIIASIPNGTTVLILGYSDHFEEINGEKSKWYNVNFNGKTGWAWGGFIKNNSNDTDTRNPARSNSENLK